MKPQRETRSKITTISVRPSVYTKMQKISFIINTPINSLINKFMEDFVEENQYAVEQYDQLYGENN